MWVRKAVTGLFVLWIMIIVFINIYVFQNATGVDLFLGGRSYRYSKTLQTIYDNTHGVNALGSLIKSGKLSSKDAPGVRNLESVDKSEPSTEHEVVRRKLEDVSTEFWLFVRSELKSLNQNRSKIDVSKLVDGILDNSIGYQSMLKKYFHELENEVDGHGAWRYGESQKLGDLVQRRLNYLQNPENCENAKKLVCKVMADCGYGCMLHHVTECLINAYATRRTLVLTEFNWKYSDEGLESVFQPLSRTCNSTTAEVSGKNSTDSEEELVLEMIHDRNKHSISTVLPMAVPDDLGDRLIHFHGDPSAWWIGQFVTYLTRPNFVTNVYLQRRRKYLGFENPIVGVHVRRTDKLIAEAQFHSVQEYMTHVEEWFDAYALRNPDVQRRVYLASDDPEVLPEARKRYPHYTFVSDNFTSKTSWLDRRYVKAPLQGILLDTHLLSLCDYLVCTFSSGVCRLAYELMQPRHGDASRWFKSLDDIYYFGSQSEHKWMVVQKHVANNGDEISLNVGDLVHIAGNHWDGYSKGKDMKTGISGLFPSYKAVDKVDRVKMPTYPEVPDLQ